MILRTFLLDRAVEVVVEPVHDMGDEIEGDRSLLIVDLCCFARGCFSTMPERAF